MTLETAFLNKSDESSEKPKREEPTPEELEAESLRATLLVLQTYEESYE